MKLLEAKFVTRDEDSGEHATTDINEPRFMTDGIGCPIFYYKLERYVAINWELNSNNLMDVHSYAPFPKSMEIYDTLRSQLRGQLKPVKDIGNNKTQGAGLSIL